MLEWFVSSAVLAAIMLALHGLLRGRVSARLQYALWLLLLVRLLCPISIGESRMSVGNLVSEAKHTVLYRRDDTTKLPGKAGAGVAAVEDGNLEAVPSPAASAAAESGGAVRSGGISPEEVLLLVWGCGAAVVLGWFVVTNAAFSRKLRKHSTLERAGRPAVRRSTELKSPCLVGLLHPTIYLTAQSAKDETLRRHCLAHEYTHYRHGDMVWAALRGLCVALHWFDPLVWWAAWASRADAEAACDADAIALLGEGERAAYGRTLVAMSCAGRAHPLLAATTMSGRGRQLKRRIRAIARRKKTAVPMVLIVGMLAVVAVGCTMTGGTAEDAKLPEIVQAEGTPAQTETQTAEPETDITLEEPDVEQERIPTVSLEEEWFNFAVDWRLDYLPIFPQSNYSETDGLPDVASEYLMWVFATHMEDVKEAGYMETEWVTETILRHFPLRRLSLDDLPKTWVMRNGRYEALGGGVKAKPLVRLESLETDVTGERTLYTLRLTFLEADHEIVDEAEWEAYRAALLAGDETGLRTGHTDTFQFYFTKDEPVFTHHDSVMICYDAPLESDRLQDAEIVLPYGIRFGMEFDACLALCGEAAQDVRTGDGWKTFQAGACSYVFSEDEDGAFSLYAVQIRSLEGGGADEDVSPFRDIHLGDGIESVFDSFPCSDRELKQWAMQYVYGYDQDPEGYAVLQFVADSFYSLDLFTPGGYQASLTFSHENNAVTWIDLYAPASAAQAG